MIYILVAVSLVSVLWICALVSTHFCFESLCSTSRIALIFASYLPYKEIWKYKKLGGVLSVFFLRQYLYLRSQLTDE